jgi:hypothetical protein
MDHVQQQILDWFESSLIVGATAAGTHVENDRLDPWTEGELPAISITGADEAIDVSTIPSDLQERAFNVRVRSTVRQVAGYEKAARALGLQVEKVVAAGVSNAGGLCSGFVRITASALGKFGEGHCPVAVLEQNWLCTYYVSASQPDVAL